MKPEEVIKAIPGKLVIHQGNVLFNTHDLHVADHWDSLGATVRPWYSDWELAASRKRGYENPQGWEVAVLGCCEPVFIEDTDGDEVDVTKDLLIAAARDHVKRHLRVVA